VAQKPNVNFFVNNTKNCDTSSIQLINITANADNFLWVLSNGMTSTQTSPTFTLPPSSTPYTVQLIATNQQGCRDSLTKANYIRVIPRPVGDFYINPAATISIPDYTFSFTNLTLNSILYQYTWSLGDGTSVPGDLSCGPGTGGRNESGAERGDDGQPVSVLCGHDAGTTGIGVGDAADQGREGSW
jgi:hypothetical protein